MTTTTRLVTAGLMAFALLAAKKERAWQIGKLTDSRTVDTGLAPRFPTMVGGGSAAQTMGRATATTTTAELSIAGVDYTYVVRDGGSNVVFGRHACRYVVGDIVKYVQDKLLMYLIDADGTECKAQIMKQERVPQPAAPAKE